MSIECGDAREVGMVGDERVARRDVVAEVAPDRAHDLGAGTRSVEREDQCSPTTLPSASSSTQLASCDSRTIVE